ncbi:hypothetical protein IFM89_009472 [Coptis chinensis]|uniref:adenylate kinase n=1 Tax=Coptis chinensis TaxID=261450 RepID=A0A835M7L2_9MAGN|nr:hypothetical protein IFM89_009472 [Coptis chinensis]
MEVESLYGDMLRAVVSTKTPLGIKAKEAMEKGELVPDDLVVGIINEAMKTPSVRKLDGMLEKQGTKVDKVLNFAIFDSFLEERITGSWVHPSSGRTYHTNMQVPKFQVLMTLLDWHMVSLLCADFFISKSSSFGDTLGSDGYGLSKIIPVATELEESNALVLAIVPPGYVGA